jgi:hypothetical protein
MAERPGNNDLLDVKSQEKILFTLGCMYHSLGESSQLTFTSAKPVFDKTTGFYYSLPPLKLLCPEF